MNTITRTRKALSFAAACAVTLMSLSSTAATLEPAAVQPAAAGTVDSGVEAGKPSYQSNVYAC